MSASSGVVRSARTGAKSEPASLGHSAFTTIATFLHARSGLSIGPDKLYLLESRLAPVLATFGLIGLDALASRLAASPHGALANDVVEAMTINETLFFRDAKPFDHLRQTVLPALHARRSRGEMLRFWSAASSSGQEAYSLAMLLAESRTLLGDRRIEIVGTDISRAQVARAEAGIYSHFEAQRGLPIQSLVRHFDRDQNNWRIKPALRAAVSFRHANLLDDLSGLGRFDVVFCRNVLIYFDAATKRAVLDRIARQLAPDGMLYLGGAETTLGVTTRFTKSPAEPGWRPAQSG